MNIIVPILGPLLLQSNSPFFAQGTSFPFKGFVIGAIISATYFGAMITAPLVGKLSDRFGRKKVLVLILFGNAISYVLIAIGIMLTSLELLFLGRFFKGVMQTDTIAFAGLIDLSWKHKHHNFTLGNIAVRAGDIAGPLIGGIFADSNIVSWFTYETPFWIAVGLILFNASQIILFFKDHHKFEHHLVESENSIALMKTWRDSWRIFANKDQTRTITFNKY